MKFSYSSRFACLIRPQNRGCDGTIRDKLRHSRLEAHHVARRARTASSTFRPEGSTPNAPSAAINHCLSVHDDLEFAVATTNHFNVARQLAPKLGRHTGGVQPRDSIRAIMNGDPAHKDLLRFLSGRFSRWPCKIAMIQDRIGH